MYGKILVPYDSSFASDKALEHAVQLARSVGSQLIILHVIPEIPMSKINLEIRPANPDLEDVYLAEKLVSVYDVMTKAAAADLEAKKKEYRPSGVTISIAVMVGHVVDTIINFAKKEEAGLIVISNIGSGGSTGRGILGSVSRSVAERASCPVLIVRHSS